MRRLSLPACLAALAATLPAAASAQMAPGWEGHVTLYGWLPTVDGSQTGPSGGPNEIPRIDLDAESIFDALDFAFMGSAELRRGQFGLLFDVVYADLSTDGRTARLGLDAEVGTKLGMFTAAGLYRVYDAPNAGTVDLLAGIRPTWVDADFTLELPNRQVQRRTTESWVDPLVGVKGTLPLNDRFSVAGIADVGGFSIGSNLTWELIGTLSYAFNDRFHLVGGYRFLSIDYEASDLELDIDVKGPVIGISYHF